MTLKLAFNTDEAAALCGVSPDTIKRAIRSGALRAKRSGRLTRDSSKGDKGDPAGKYLMFEDDLREWLDGLEDA